MKPAGKIASTSYEVCSHFHSDEGCSKNGCTFIHVDNYKGDMPPAYIIHTHRYVNIKKILEEHLTVVKEAQLRPLPVKDGTHERYRNLKN